MENKKNIITTIFILLITTFLLETTGVIQILQNPVQKILMPVQLSLYKTKKDVGGFLTTLSEIKSLRENENKLAAENAILLAENAKLKNLGVENKALREQLGAKNISKKLILAQVIGSDPLLSGSKILVDKGSNFGVSKGDLVVVKDILIGQVIAVGSSSASVRLINDSETKIAVITEGGTRGIVKGEFGAGVVLDKVVQGRQVSVGEIVFTSGEADIPSGLALGTVSKVSSDPADLFQKASIKALIPYESLEIVFVVKN